MSGTSGCLKAAISTKTQREKNKALNLGVIYQQSKEV